jgi:hypothetical protein
MDCRVCRVKHITDSHLLISRWNAKQHASELGLIDDRERLKASDAMELTFMHADRSLDEARIVLAIRYESINLLICCTCGTGERRLTEGCADAHDEYGARRQCAHVSLPSKGHSARGNAHALIGVDVGRRNEWQAVAPYSGHMRWRR